MKERLKPTPYQQSEDGLAVGALAVADRRLTACLL